MATQPTPASEANVDALVIAMNANAEAQTKQAEALSQYTQTIEAGLKQAADDARERANEEGATEEDRKREARHLAEKLALGRALSKATGHPQRKSQLSMSEMNELLAEQAELGGHQAKMLYAKIGRERAKDSKTWNRIYEDRKPLDVLIKGALVPVTGRLTVGGTKTTTQAYEPITAGSEDEVLREAQDLNDAVLFWYLAKKAVKNNESVAPVRMTDCPLFERYTKAMRDLTLALGGEKALDSTELSDWVPTGFSAALIEYYELERNLMRFVDVFVMPRNPFDMPRRTNRVRFSLVTEATSDPETPPTAIPTSDLTGNKVNFSLVDLAIRTSMSTNVEEDSIVPLMNEARMDMARAWGYDEEDMVLNGDTAGTHQDSDSDTAGDIRKAVLGFRAAAVDNSYTTDLNAIHQADGYRSIKALMGRFGVRASELVWVISAQENAYLLTLKDENDNPVMIGNAASVATPNVQTIDQVPMLFGSPVVVSEASREDLAADGLHDGVTEDNHATILFNRRGFSYAYTNAAPRFYTDFTARTLQNELVMHIRRDFKARYALASNHALHYAYNIDN